MHKVRQESGIAMVVVLFVSVVLTVVASTAAFVTIREFSANSDDRRGAQALAYSEAAIDRTIAEIEGGRWTWKALVSSGCDDPTLTARSLNPDDFPLYVGASLQANGRNLTRGTGGDIGGGMYRAVMTHCLGSGATFPRPRGERQMTLRAIGEHPTARREIVQQLLVEPKGLPVGIYANSFVASNGSGDLRNVSLISPGPISGRDQIGFAGLDPWYEKSDFYPCTGGLTPPACFPEDGDDIGDMPASVHSGDLITCQGNCPRSSNTQPLNVHEHPGAPDTRSPNCDANRSSGTSQQSLWDGDDWTGTASEATITALNNTCTWTAPAGWSGVVYPPTSLFTDLDARRLAPTPQLSEDDLSALEEQAKANGIYCGTEISGSFDCYKQGVLRNAIEANPGARVQGTLQPPGTGDLVGMPRVFTAFFDFPVGATNRTVNWGGDMSVNGVEACVQGANHQSVTIIIRNGNLTGSGGVFINGTVIANEGEVDLNGNYTINGTVIARSVEIISGAEVTLDQCWIDNLQSASLEVSPLSWSEIDR